MPLPKSLSFLRDGEVTLKNSYHSDINSQPSEQQDTAWYMQLMSAILVLLALGTQSYKPQTCNNNINYDLYVFQGKSCLPPTEISHAVDYTEETNKS